MTIGPTLFRPQAVPFPTRAAGVTGLFFAVLAVVVDRWVTIASLALAAAFGAAAVWYWLRAKRSAVLIDTDQFTIKQGSRQDTFDRADIESVDLSMFRGQVTLVDGRTVSLPLDGKQLVEAGLLLSPGSAGRRR